MTRVITATAPEPGIRKGKRRKRKFTNFVIYPKCLFGRTDMVLSEEGLGTMDAIAHHILNRICEHAQGLQHATGKKTLKDSTIQAACRLTFPPTLFAAIEKQAYESLRSYKLHTNRCPPESE